MQTGRKGLLRRDRGGRLAAAQPHGPHLGRHMITATLDTVGWLGRHPGGSAAALVGVAAADSAFKRSCFRGREPPRESDDHAERSLLPHWRWRS